MGSFIGFEVGMIVGLDVGSTDVGYIEGPALGFAVEGVADG